jgi:hypothetical protein
MAESWMRDTDVETLKVYADMIRGMTESQRMMRVFELCELQRAIVAAGVRRQFPKAGEDEVFLRVAARILDRQQMIDVYNWDPEQHR